MKKCAFKTVRYDDRGRPGDFCIALEKCECDGCSFYKTEEEAAEGRRMAAMRLMLLDGGTRRKLFDKYYRNRNGRILR